MKASKSLVVALVLMTVPIVSLGPMAAQGSELQPSQGPGASPTARPWQYMREITIDNTGNNDTLTDYQVLIQFDTVTPIAEGKMNADGSDLRFTADFAQGLDYWIEDGIQGEFGMNQPDTKVWVKVPHIAGSASTTVYMLYGNPAAPAMSDIQATFILGDDFNDNDLDLSRWQVTVYGQGLILEQNQRLEHLSPRTYPSSGSTLESTRTFTEPVAMEMRLKKGGYVYRWFELADDREYKANWAGMFITDCCWVGFQVGIDGAEDNRIVEGGFWSREYNPEYYLQVIWRPDGGFVINGSVPGFEPGGPKNWSQTFTQVMPPGTPLKVFAREHIWQGAWWLWDRYEDDIRVRKYTEPEPVITIGPEIPVSFGPVLRVEPASLSAEQCPNTVTKQLVHVCNDGDLPFDWSVLSSPPWLWWNPSSGTVLPWGCQQVGSRFDSHGLAPGHYEGDVDGTWWLGSFFDVFAELTVRDPVHDADFSWTPLAPLPGETVTFTGWAQGSEPIDYTWDFGDGIIGSGQKVAHAYAASGDYGVTLTVSNECGQAIVLHTITVAGEPAEQRLHIGQMKMGWRPADYGHKANARLNIHDELHQLTGFVKVFGTWTLPGGLTLDQSTMADRYGRAKFRIKYPVGGIYQFCVTDLVKAGYVYDPEANHAGPCMWIMPPLGGERLEPR